MKVKKKTRKIENIYIFINLSIYLSIYIYDNKKNYWLWNISRTRFLDVMGIPHWGEIDALLVVLVVRGWSCHPYLSHEILWNK